MNSVLSENRRGSLEETSEMLPTDPPPRIARAIAWLFIVIFFAAIAAAIFVRVPETVRCRFVLVPRDGADPIQSPYAAVVAEVRVTEGAEVPAGTELFILRSDEIGKLTTELQTISEDLSAKQQAAIKLDAAFAAQLEIKDGEIAQVRREIQFREQHASTSRDLVTRLAKLQTTGGISAVELIKHQLELAESEKDLNVSMKLLDQTLLEKKRMETDRARQRNDEATETRKLELRIDALKTRLGSAAGERLTIRAPYNAVVLSLAQRNAGTVINAGQELCQLARVDAIPLARLSLSERGLPKLAVEQQVRLFFDAFPYQRYGTSKGTLEWISPAAVSSADGQMFVARAVLAHTWIRVGGQQRQLRAGMKGEARIVVGSRRLIEYAFEPVRQLRENLRR
jgi:multidrug efflux pump subunit AcrA (membrane-fusion protein)